MNTGIMSELFLMNKLQNDPINYESKGKKKVVTEPAKAATSAPSRLRLALNWLAICTRRTGRVIL
jgi:hypothetical protein